VTDRSADPPGDPGPPVPSIDANQSSFLDLFTVPVPSGAVESPLEDRHVLDIHLGEPVQVACRIDNRVRQGPQVEGHICVLPAGMKSRWMMTRPAQALILRLTPALLQDTANAMGLSARDAELVPSIQMRDPYIERIAWMLQAEHATAYPSGRIFADSLASALAARLLGLQSLKAASVPKTNRALPPRRLRNVIDYIEAHLDANITLTELATVAGFSLSHFKSLFKQAVGLPVHRYVLGRRVERARALLLAGEKTMVEIALETGFSHPSHMARCVRRVLGVSPSQIAGSSR
jgi:AraC family transcriptional regulator